MILLYGYVWFCSAWPMAVMQYTDARTNLNTQITFSNTRKCLFFVYIFPFAFIKRFLNQLTHTHINIYVYSISSYPLGDEQVTGLGMW